MKSSNSSSPNCGRMSIKEDSHHQIGTEKNQIFLCSSWPLVQLSKKHTNFAFLSLLLFVIWPQWWAIATTTLPQHHSYLWMMLLLLLPLCCCCVSVNCLCYVWKACNVLRALRAKAGHDGFSRHCFYWMHESLEWASMAQALQQLSIDAQIVDKIENLLVQYIYLLIRKIQIPKKDG